MIQRNGNMQITKYLGRIFFLLKISSFSKTAYQDEATLIQFKGIILTFQTPDHPRGSYVIPPVGSSVYSLVRPSVHPSLNISETAHSIFLKLCMKLRVNKVKKVTRPEFLKKTLISETQSPLIPGLRFFQNSGRVTFLLY